MTKLSPNDFFAFTLLTIAIFTGDDAAGQTTVSSVSGKLINESGHPLPGVAVTYRKDMKYISDGRYHLVPAPGEHPAGGTVTTHADGTFSAANLPVGSYTVCLNNPPDGYVDHCAWNLAAATFTIAVGTNTAMKPVTVISGVRIHFMITDPQGLLPSGSALDQTAQIGVVTPRGIYRPAAVNSRSGPVTEFVVTVPHTQAVSTSLFSRTLKFKDSLGNLAASAAVNVPQGATDQQISLTVSK